MKILIAVESCVDHANREQAQMDTWAKVIPAYWSIFFFNGENLGVPDDYKSLPTKTKAICQFAREFGAMVKVDTDTYLSIERLSKFDFFSHDYVGHELDWLSKPGYASGPCYILSNKALNILADADWSQISAHGHESNEDVMVGAVLRANGIFVHHDERFALYRDVLPDNDVISSHLSSRESFRIEMMYEAHKKALGL